MSLQVVALNELLSTVAAFVWLIKCVHSPVDKISNIIPISITILIVALHMKLIFLLVLKRARAHRALVGILINVRFDVRLQVVGLCKLLLANLKSNEI